MKGSLQKKHGKYYAVIRIDGKQKWINLHIPTTRGNRRKAEQAFKKVVADYTDTGIVSSNLLFLEYLDIWLSQIKQLVKPSSYESYEKIVNGKIKPYFQDKGLKLMDLRGMHFTEYFVYLKEQGRSDGKGGLSKKAVTNIRGVLSSALKYAVENELLYDNVIERSRMPIFDKQVFAPIIYTSEQIKTLLSYAEETKSKACLFLFLEMFTGARKGELLALTWDNVDFDNDTIHICRNRTGSKKEVLNVLTSPKTKNGFRTIPLPPKVMNMLKAEYEQQQQNKLLLGQHYVTYDYDYVIRKEDGSIYNPNSINRIINKMTDKLGLPHCRVHDYRHTVASILFESGAGLSDVTVQLGHGQTSTTERIYIHRQNVANKANMQVLSKTIDV